MMNLEIHDYKAQLNFFEAFLLSTQLSSLMSQVEIVLSQD